MHWGKRARGDAVPLQCDPKIILALEAGTNPNYRLQRQRSARRHHQTQGGAAGQNIVKNCRRG
jgi:hypothetical protein